MSIEPNTSELIARARSDLRLGLPIVVGQTLICAVETVSQPRFAALRATYPDLSLAISHRRAAILKVAAYDGALARLELPQDVSLGWLQAVADPALDLHAPLKGPFRARRDTRAGHSVLGLFLVKTAQLLPAALVVEVVGTVPFGVTQITPEALADALDVSEELVRIASAKVPTQFDEGSKLHVFRSETSGEEHYAIEIGTPDRDKPVLTRLHSACFTGDILGSLKCDCGAQLHAALQQMQSEGAGILLYLNQEGRGIGLANKMRAYSLQDQGFDTVEANHRLGFDDDERDFRLGSGILRRMGFSKIRLMTNNPAKVARMAQDGFEIVDRVPLKVGQTSLNADYLATKATKSGHLL